MAMFVGGMRRVGLSFAGVRGRAVLCVAAAALAFGAGGANAAASQAPDNWTQWAFNAQHTGYNPHVTGLGRSAVATLKPVFATRLVTEPDPIVVNGKVYLANSGTFVVQAVDAATGAKLWARQGCIQETPSDPAFAGGSVWVALDDPGFASVSAGGAKIKCIEPLTSLYDTPPSAARGTVYAGSESGVVTAVDAVTGHVRWSKEVAPKQQPSLDSPTVSPDGRFLFVSGSNGVVYKLNANTGQVLWSHFIDTCAGLQGHFAVSVTASLVYVGGCNLYALSRATGHVVWRTSRFGPNVTTPTIIGDKVIATTTGPSGSSSGVAAFDATTGRRLWTAGNSATVPLTAADGVVYVNEGSDLEMLNTSNGKPINGLLSPSGSFVGSVVLAEGRIYVCTVETSTGVATLRAYQPAG
jgi:outer membrane protein assembly factor BamB